MTAQAKRRWQTKMQRPCLRCGVLITGFGTSGKCLACWRATQGGVPTVVCRMCKEIIDLKMPRYQYIYVTSGGKTGRQNKRSLVATICEECWDRNRG